jgi:hypothetical protein
VTAACQAIRAKLASTRHWRRGFNVNTKLGGGEGDDLGTNGIGGIFPFGRQVGQRLGTRVEIRRQRNDASRCLGRDRVKETLANLSRNERSSDRVSE